jgi:anti-sigma factor RsiW
VIDLRRSCRRQRTALFDFVVGGLRGPDTAGALDHLDRCDRCRAEVESTVLAAAALRRLATDVLAVEPSADAWPRLRDRVAGRPAPRLAFASPVAGMAMSLAIVVASVVGAPGLPGSEPEAPGPIVSVASDQLEPVEEAWLRGRVTSARRTSVGETVAAPVQTPSRAPSFLGPDGLGTPILAVPDATTPAGTSIE